MQDTGSLGLVYWDDPEGWYRERGGGVSGWVTRVHLWRMHVDVWQNQYNIVKLKKKSNKQIKKNKGQKHTLPAFETQLSKQNGTGISPVM